MTFWLPPIYIGLVVFLTTNSCIVDQRQKKSASSQLVVRDSVVFERLNTGDSARIAFKLSKPGFCQLKIWNQDEEGGKPKASQPLSHDCQSQDQAQTSFIEPIHELDPNSLYFISIEASLERNGSPNDVYVFEERQGKGLGSNLFFARLNLPSRVGEVGLFKSDKELNIAELRRLILKPTGCQKVGSGTMSSQFTTSGLHRLKATGFALASAEPHPYDRQRLQLEFDVFDPLQLWQWSYVLIDNAFNFQLPLPNHLSRLNIVGDNSMEYNKTLLNPQPAGLVSVSENTEALKLEWAQFRVDEPWSQLTVSIGHPGSSEVVTCVFDAGSESASIPRQDLMTSLKAKGVYPFVVTLSSYTLQVYPKSQPIPWLFHASDWRSGRIQI